MKTKIDPGRRVIPLIIDPDEYQDHQEADPLHCVDNVFLLHSHLTVVNDVFYNMAGIELDDINLH